MCGAHHTRWCRQGYPDFEGFLVATSPETKGHGTQKRCGVAGCERGRSRQGLCNRHAKVWDKADRPALAAWLPTVSPPEPGESEPCAVPGCVASAEPRRAFTERPSLCKAHLSRWRWLGRPGLAELSRWCATYGEATVDFSRLPGQLRLELQYGTQCRVDDHTTRLPAHCLQQLVRCFADAELGSLLADRDEAHRVAGQYAARSTQRAFVGYTIQRLEDLLAGSGWDREYPRDCWQLARLGIAKGTGGRATLRFDGIELAWLRELVKRHARLRLTTGRSASQVGTDVLALTRLSQVLVDAAGPEATIADLDRAVIERYLAWLHSQGHGNSSQRGHTAALMTFLQALRRLNWASALPSDAMVYPDDYPSMQQQASRNLSEHVMAQVEEPANLDRFADPAMRVLTELLVRTGLRGGDARKLPIDCCVRDDDGAAYLRYHNHKPAREAFVPIDEDLAALIGDQQRRVRRRWPEGRVRLFPGARNNPAGHTPIGRCQYARSLARWIEDCDIRDDTGARVHLTPHQFRHTYGTRLINSGVPEEVVRKLLDHDSPDMTAHYARLKLKTVRREWEKARKVDIAGDPVVVDPDGPLSDAAWMKENLGRAKQALPNGYCGLPLQQTCPHANACLTCPVFVTTAEFLPQHHQQRANTLTLIASAQADGHARMAEMNQQVLASLDHIITALEAPDTDTDACAEADDAG